MPAVDDNLGTEDLCRGGQAGARMGRPSGSPVLMSNERDCTVLVPAPGLLKMMDVELWYYVILSFHQIKNGCFFLGTLPVIPEKQNHRESLSRGAA